MDKFQILEDCIFINPEINPLDAKGVITFLCEALNKKGLVDTTYSKSVIDREQNFPTALPTLPYAVAIPHADNPGIKNTSIALATLKQPVEFKAMDSPKKTLNVRLVLLMALSDRSYQVTMLQWISRLVQDQASVESLVLAKTTAEILNILQKYIQ